MSFLDEPFINNGWGDFVDLSYIIPRGSTFSLSHETHTHKEKERLRFSVCFKMSD